MGAKRLLTMDEMMGTGGSAVVVRNALYYTSPCHTFLPTCLGADLWGFADKSRFISTPASVSKGRGNGVAQVNLEPF